MGDDKRLKVFISSSMEELDKERTEVTHRLDGSDVFQPWGWERDAVASPVKSPVKQFREAVRGCHVCVSLFAAKLGHWTKKEYDDANEANRPVFTFLRRGDEPEPGLRAFLEEIGLLGVEQPGTAQYFATPDELADMVHGSLKDHYRSLHDVTYSLPEGIGAGREQATPTADGLADRKRRDGKPKFVAVEQDAINRLQASGAPLVGRAEAVNALRDALTAALEKDGRRLVALVGRPGVGRRALLKRAAWEHGEAPADWPAFPDGAWLTPAWHPREGGDLLQAVWDELYERGDEGEAPVRAARSRQLRDKRVLIVLPNVDQADPEHVEGLLEVMHHAVVVVTLADTTVALPVEPGDGGHRDVVTRHGVWLDVPGLEPDRVLELFKLQYYGPKGGEVPEEVRPLVVRNGKVRGGLPLDVLAVADDAGRFVASGPKGLQRSPAALAAWAAAKSPAAAPARPRLQLRVDAVHMNSTKVPTPGLVLSDLANRPANVSAPLTIGLGTGQFEQHSPRYTLAPGYADLVEDRSDDPKFKAMVVDSALLWASQADDAEVYESRAFVLVVLEWAASIGRSADVVTLAKRIETPLALGARWMAWGSALRSGSAAAAAEEDDSADAYFNHQRGTRELLLGNPARAVRLLRRARRTRREMDDHAAARLSGRNLRRAWWAVLIMWLPFIILAAITMAISQVVGGPIDDFAEGFPTVGVPRAEGDLPRLSHRSLPEGRPFEGDVDMTVAITGDADFCIYQDGACFLRTGSERGTLPPGPLPGMPLAAAAEDDPAEPCRLAKSGPATATIRVPAEEQCEFIFAFDPRSDDPDSYRARVEFGVGGLRFEGDLAGDTATGVPPPLRVEMSVDADADGEHHSEEVSAVDGGVVDYEVRITSTHSEPLELVSVTDSHLGGVMDEGGTGCSAGRMILPGAVAECRFRGPAVDRDGRHDNIVTVHVTDAGQNMWSDSAAARVRFVPVTVTRTVDADGDGVFAPSEVYPHAEPGPVSYRVEVALGDGVSVVAIDDPSCGPPYPCTVVVAPAAEPLVSVVAVRVDPPLESPYTAGAEVRFVPVRVDLAAAGTVTAGAGAEASFLLTVGNDSAEALELTSVRDGTGREHDCPLESIGPGGGYECRFGVPVEGGPGSTFQDTVEVRFRAPAVETIRVSNAVSIDVHSPVAVSATSDAPEGGAREVAVPVVVEGSTQAVTLEGFTFDVPGFVATTCTGPVPLAPLAEHTCEVTVEAGGDAGEAITGRAAVSARAGVETHTADGDVAVAFVNAEPALAVVLSGPTTARRGDTVELTARIVNASDAATDPVDLFRPCVVTELAPGAAHECPVRVQVSGGDPFTALVTAEGEDDEERRAATTGRHPIRVAGMSLAATHEGGADVAEGTELGHRFTVVNSGGVELVDVAVVDSRLGAVCTRPRLRPGEQATCTVRQTVTESVGTQVTATARATARTDPRRLAVSATATDTFTVAAHQLVLDVVTDPASWLRFDFRLIPVAGDTELISLRHGDEPVTRHPARPVTVRQAGTDADPSFWAPLPAPDCLVSGQSGEPANCTFRYRGTTALIDADGEAGFAFDGVAAGEKASRPLTLTNSGSATAPQLRFAAPDGFSVFPATCGPLAPGQACTVQVQFAPPARGTYFGDVSWGGPGGDVRLPVAGVSP